MAGSEGADPYAAFDEGALRDLATLLGARDFDPDQVPPDVAAALTSAKHSPSATGARMQAFIRHLLEHHPSRTADHTKAWEAVLPACDTLSPLRAYVVRNLLGKDANDGYDPIPDDMRLEFPRDHAVKLRCQTGWHFFVGSCWDTDGQEYGIELMFFGNAVFPPAFAAEQGLDDLENQLVEVQLAISTAGGRHHQAEPIVAAGTSGLITIDDDPFAFRLGTNEMVSLQPGELFPMQVRSWGLDRGEDPALELAIDLRFTPGRGILEQGDAGALPVIDGIGTCYYSIPGIGLDPEHSTLRIGDREVRLARGVFWFDHQWGQLTAEPLSTALRAAGNVAEPDPEGWDWFMAQFDGNRQLTMAAPHKAALADQYYFQTGANPPPTMEVRVGGKYMADDSSTRPAWGTLRVTDWVKTEHSPSPDRYPPTHTWHPNHWEFVFDDLPDDIATFTMAPIVEGGQSAFFAHGAQICEGAVRLLDAGGAEIGRGFAESVRYADTRRAELRLAGLPDTDELVELLAPKAPPLGTKLRNMLYVLTHRHQLEDTLERARGMEYLTDPQA